jgi:hypothetical protein
MHKDPNTYRDKELTITGYKTCVLRDLAKMDIPDKMDPAFSTATDNQDRAFRKQITIAEMITICNTLVVKPTAAKLSNNCMIIFSQGNLRNLFHNKVHNEH